MNDMTQKIESEIISHLIELLEKAGFQSLVPLYPSDSLEDEITLDTLLITVKSLNARYDKHEALAQIQCLLNKYNIQMDQLIEKQGSL
jgi:hypothetical protein